MERTSLPLPTAHPARRAWLAMGLAAGVIIAWLALTPPALLDKADYVGYAVCHRIPSHSFFIAGRQLPLCARCTGTFSGALLGIIALTLAGRRRASRFPPVRVLLVMALFFLAWAFDGLNSYLTFFPDAPHLYTPRNELRLTTGTFVGLSLSLLVYPLLNFSLWRSPDSTPVVRDFGEFAGLLAIGGLFILIVLSRHPLLLYPLALTGALGVLAMLTGLNTVLVLVLTRQENRAVRWWDALPSLLVGLALSLTLIGGIDALRYAITRGAMQFPLR